jgi:hypothetical protein
LVDGWRLAVDGLISWQGLYKKTMKYFQACIFFILCNGTGFVYAMSIVKHPSPVNRQPSTIHQQLPTLNRPAFYKAMEGENKTLVNIQLTELKSMAPSNARDAFTGAMIMKQAGLGGSPTTKLHLFKEGHKMLESAIKQDPDNAEYRFLRLMIQENAPGFLGYKNDEQKDIEYIRKSYKSLPEDLQNAITDYNKKSKILKLDLS